MNKIDNTKERIIAMLNRETSKTRLEQAAIAKKMEDAEEWYGQGKRYQAYWEKLDKKLQEEERLMDMKTRFGGFVPTQETGFLTMYGFACPSCRMHVYLDQDKLMDYQNGTVNCPVCGRKIYRDGRSTSWEVLVDSKTVKE